MSSQDFPGSSWEDSRTPDERRSGYRPADEEAYVYQAPVGQPPVAPHPVAQPPVAPPGYGQAGYSQASSPSRPSRSQPVQPSSAPRSQPRHGRSQPTATGYGPGGSYAGNGSGNGNGNGQSGAAYGGSPGNGGYLPPTQPRTGSNGRSSSASYPGNGSGSASYPGNGRGSASYPANGNGSSSYPPSGNGSSSYPASGNGSSSYPPSGSGSASYPSSGRGAGSGSRRGAGYGPEGRGSKGYPPPDGNGYAADGQSSRSQPYGRSAPTSRQGGGNGTSDYRANPASAPRNGAGGYPGGPGGAGGDYRNGDATGYRSGPGRNGVADEFPARARDDSGVWYRLTGRFDTTGFGLKALRSNRTGSPRPGYYNPDDDPGFGDRTGRYGTTTGYAPGRRPGDPGTPGDPARQPGRSGGGSGGRRGAGSSGGRSPRGYVNPDDGAPLIKRILRKVWYGNWWRRWTIKKAALLLGGLAAFTALMLVASFFVVLSSTTVPIAALSQPLTQSSTVYFANGKEVGCFCTADRTVLSEHQIKRSKTLVAAVLAAEDRNFFTEGGISVTGILRAAKSDLSGGSIQGASTITEQFVKTYYDKSLLGNLSYNQKVKEIFVAIKLAKMEPKWWILWHYLNAIPLGAGANGVEAAAETYFHVKAWQLSVPQAAMIAAMIQSPYGYQPTDPASAATGLGNSLLDRWVYVLTNMVRDGAITQNQLTQLVPDPSQPSTGLKNFPKVNIKSQTWKGSRGYIMDLVVSELQAYYGYSNDDAARIGTLGLKIHTTINERLMTKLTHTIDAEKKSIAGLLGTPFPYYINLSAVVEKPGTGKIVAFYGGHGFGTKNCQKYHCNLNAILAPEPVGSSFKPYVLTTAVSQGMDVRDSVMNSHSPLCIPPDYTTESRLELSKQTRNCDTHIGYAFFNEPSENSGSINETVPGATATSNDPAYEDLIHRTTIQSVLNMAGTLGVSSSDVLGLNKLFGNGCLTKYPKLHCTPGSVQAALGEGDLTAVDQANTFSTLVSGGISVTPHIIDFIINNGVRESAHVVKTRAIQPEVAGDVDYALSFDTSTSPPGGGGVGTGYPNAVWDRPMIAKTGTLGEGDFASQAWFIGAIPQYSMSVGMFTDRPNGAHKQVLDGLPKAGGIGGSYGGAWPATIWRAFMSQQFSNLAVKPLPPQGYTGDNPLFTKWVMAPKPKPKPKKCKLPGNGHHHHFFFGHGNGNGKNCQGNPNPNPTPNPPGAPPTPNPTPSGFPTPNPPTPTPSGSPTPTVSIAPPPSSAPPSPAAAVPGTARVQRSAARVPHPAPERAPKAPRPASDLASYSAAATPGLELTRRLGWLT